MRWDEGCRDENSHLCLVLEIGQLIGHKTKHIISFLWEFNKNSLTEGSFSGGREGIGQLFGGGIDIFDDWDSGEETVSPANQFAAQDIGRNQSDQIEQEEEGNGSNPWEMV